MNALRSGSRALELCLVLALPAATPAMAQQVYVPYAISTLAGIAPGSADGTGVAAQFTYPGSVATDSSGNIYVADTSNCTIRKITPGGVVTTFAGLAGSYGRTDGTGTAARFDYPGGVAVDGSGNVYVADTNNCTIRKITPGGVVTTLAGSAGYYGSTDGTGTGALFNYPEGVAVDGSGNVYVADTGNDTIRLITPGGVVTTLAGSPGSSGSANGTGTGAQFNSPGGVAVDGSGNVYVADTDNGTIRLIASGGVVTTLAGSPGSFGSADGTGSAAQFSYADGVAVDASGNVYVADTDNSVIREITVSGGVGTVTTLAGTASPPGDADGTGSAARFALPGGVAVDGSGNVYVADTDNDTIRRIAPGGVVTTLAGAPDGIGSADGTGPAAKFFFPQNVAVDSSGNLYVADTENCIIREIAPGGVVTTLAGTPEVFGSADGTGAAAQFYFPRGVAVDGSGNVYVADSGNDTIRKITPGGVVTTLAGSPGTYGAVDGPDGGALFNSPYGVAVDGSGNVYVADTGNCTIREITTGGVVATLAGMAGFYGSANGAGTNALFYYPFSVAVDGSGNIYVADTYNQMIRKVAAGSATVTTLAGTAGTAGGTDTTSTTVGLFDNPEGVAVDGSGNVYVADTTNQTIREVSPTGVVTTLAGSVNGFGGADGAGSAAQFRYPSGVAVDDSGNLYVADTDNNTIREGTLVVPPTIPTQPVSVTLAAGQTASFYAPATGGGTVSYQWYLNGTAIANATDAYLLVTPVSSANAGSYTCVATDAAGSTTSGAATLTLSASADPGRLTNVSVRTNCGTGAANIIAGFVIGGSGTNSSSKEMLIRADGPELGTLFSVPGSLPDPSLDVFNTTDSPAFSVGQNTGWCVTTTNENAVLAAGSPVYAFSLTTNSASSATVLTLPSDQYTENVTGASGDTGIALAEVYDVTNATESYSPVNPRLINVSARANVATGAGNLIAGFTIGGSTDKTVLVRGTGPGLAEFGLTGLLDQPTLAVYSTSSGNTLVAANTGWGEDSVLSSVANSVYAFAQTSSADCSLLVTLPPGTYTANLNSGDGTSGIALVEVYEVP